MTFRRVLQFVTPLLLCAVCAFAQSSAFGQAAQGIGTEMIFVGKWIGIILCIVCGIGLMVGEHHSGFKIIGLFVGLIFALFASPIVNWVQAL